MARAAELLSLSARLRALRQRVRGNNCGVYGEMAAYSARALAGAIDAAKEEARGVPPVTELLGHTQSSLALAYSNRAVLRWLTHDDESAISDLTRARALAPSADFVRKNSTAIGEPRAAARAEAPSG